LHCFVADVMHKLTAYTEFLIIIIIIMIIIIIIVILIIIMIVILPVLHNCPDMHHKVSTKV